MTDINLTPNPSPLHRVRREGSNTCLMPLSSPLQLERGQG
jgi:hypothetical protein